jgi:sulfur relay (sulfurtransferase) complex TusBCD TusD component (DsrE family)
MLDLHYIYFFMMSILYKTLQKTKLQCNFCYVCALGRGVLYIESGLGVELRTLRLDWAWSFVH